MIFHFSLFTFHFAEGDGERVGERLRGLRAVERLWSLLVRCKGSKLSGHEQGKCRKSEVVLRIFFGNHMLSHPTSHVKTHSTQYRLTLHAVSARTPRSIGPHSTQYRPTLHVVFWTALCAPLRQLMKHHVDIAVTIDRLARFHAFTQLPSSPYLRKAMRTQMAGHHHLN